MYVYLNKVGYLNLIFDDIVMETAHEEATGFGDNCFLFSLSTLDAMIISLTYNIGCKILVNVLHN